MAEIIILRRIPPLTRRRIDIIPGHGGGDAGDHAGEVDGVGLQGGNVEVAAVHTVAAVPFGGHFAYGSPQCAAAAIVGLGSPGGAAGDGVGELVGEGIEVAVGVEVADLVGALCGSGVDEGVLEAGFELLLEVAAVEGVVEGGGGGVVDEVLLQLGAEAGLGVDILHAELGVESLQHACGDHGGEQGADVVAGTQGIQRGAEIAFVVDEGGCAEAVRLGVRAQGNAEEE